MPTFRVDLPIWATAYVEAASREEAIAKLTKEFGTPRPKPGDRNEGVDNNDLEEVWFGGNCDIELAIDVKLSAVATAYGFNPDLIENMDEE